MIDDQHPQRRVREDDPSADDLGFDLPAPARPSNARLVVICAGSAIVLSLAFVVGFLPRYRAKHELLGTSQRAEDASPRVQVITAKAKTSDRAMVLPGSVQALEEATIYPRASGYVRSWKADIGDHVAKGALLAEIDTPEVDQQLAQARAQLAQAEAGLVQAQANVVYSASALGRFKALAPAGVTSQQELDKAESQAAVDRANVQVAEANVQSQKSNIGRFAQMQAYSRIVAPFAGTVNVRSIERGTLVSPSSPLFKVSQIDTVRVFVQVPQDIASAVVADVAAAISVREFAGRTFAGKVARTAGALDPASRTMNVEIRVPNPKHELIVGMYAQVSLTLPSPHQVWELPATAVMTDARGVRVAVVEDGKLRLARVVIERDDGATIEIASGITDKDRVVKLGSATLLEGAPVEVTP